MQVSIGGGQTQVPPHDARGMLGIEHVDSVTADLFRRSALALLVAGVLAVPAVSRAQPPPLPELRLDLFPAEPKAAISAAYTKALARPDDAATVGALGMTLQAWKQWLAAHEAFARAAALSPSTLDWWYLDGLVLQQLGRPAEAASRFLDALQIDATHLPARVKRAEALLDAGDHPAAAELYTQLLKEPAAEPLAAHGLGRLAALAGRPDEAASHFQQAIRAFPEFGAAYYGLALAERARGRTGEAAAALERYQQFGNRWPAVEDSLKAAVAARNEGADYQLRRGLQLADQGDLQGAIAAHEAALAIEPRLAQAHVNLISLHGRAGNWAQAEKHYREVLAIGSSLGEAHYNYAVMLGLQARWDEAAAAYRQAVAVSPRHPQAHNNLGQYLERQRLLADAESEYRKAVESEPTFRLARFNRGRMLIALGRTQEAIEVLEPLREPKDAEAPRYLFALSVALLRGGRQAEGLETAKQAQKLAVEHGQTELAAAIERDLARLTP